MVTDILPEFMSGSMRGEDRLRANGGDLIVIPKSDVQVSAFLGGLPLQLLLCHLGMMRGFDPDFPGNLSRTLAVVLSWKN